MTTLDELQAEHKPWREHNFPNQKAWEPLVGTMEELGELSHAFLKQQQEIRGSSSEHQAAMADAVGDVLIFLAGFCNAVDLKMQQCLDDAWAEVRHRDWVKERAERANLQGA